MSDGMKSQENLDRLLKHLKNGSLAARLVQAYRALDAANPQESMKTVLREQLTEVRRKIDHPKA